MGRLQVHTFYEAVGLMISAQVDNVVQDQLIEKYMMLPNQVWDDIINSAAKVSNVERWKFYRRLIERVLNFDIGVFRRMSIY